MSFTPEELAAMAAADAEIEAEFRLSNEDIRFSRAMDRVAIIDAMSPEQRKVAASKKAYREANKEKVAASKKAYREANKEKVAASKKAWYEANKEKVAASQKAYREANKEKYNAYMREYQRRRRQSRLGVIACNPSP